MRRLRPALFVAALGLLAACDVRTGGLLSYMPPNTPPAGAASLGSLPTGEAVAMAAARLRAAGIRVLSVNRGTGTIRVSGNADQLVDCGTYTQRLDNRLARFPGSVRSAVLFAFDQPGDILVREARVRSTATIRIAGGTTATATVAEAHVVTLSHTSPATGRTLWRETLNFTDAGSARFADGTTCASSGRLRDIVSG